MERYHRYTKNTNYSHEQILERWSSLQEAFYYPVGLTEYANKVLSFLQKYIRIYTQRIDMGMAGSRSSGVDMLKLAEVAEKKQLDAWAIEEYIDHYANCVMERESKKLDKEDNKNGNK